MSEVEIAKAILVEQELARRGYQLRRKGSDLAGACPVCGGADRFVITPKKNVWFCRKCAKGGDVIALVQHIDNCSFPAAVEVLAGKRPQASRETGQETLARMVRNTKIERERHEQEARENADKAAYALRLWKEGVCIWGTPAQIYLASRHCDGMFPYDRDQVFRFHPECVFGDWRLPCLLSLMRNIQSDEPQAIQRTALTSDGQKLGDRMTLGPKAGAAIKLWPQSAISDRLVVGEGIETVLSAALHIHPRCESLQPAWACVDAGNLAELPVLPGVQLLTILVDNDQPDKHGRQAGQDKARECSRRWVSAGRTVRRLTPKKRGADFNDIVLKV